MRANARLRSRRAPCFSSSAPVWSVAPPPCAMSRVTALAPRTSCSPRVARMSNARREPAWLRRAVRACAAPGCAPPASSAVQRAPASPLPRAALDRSSAQARTFSAASTVSGQRSSPAARWAAACHAKAASPAPGKPAPPTRTVARAAARRQRAVDASAARRPAMGPVASVAPPGPPVPTCRTTPLAASSPARRTRRAVISHPA